jgi:hypothetical protein
MTIGGDVRAGSSRTTPLFIGTVNTVRGFYEFVGRFEVA